LTTVAERALRYDLEHARNLRALAYRMLGSRTDAEDIVQEAWLHWTKVDESAVSHAGAYLSRVVTNLCLDKLGSAAKRERYTGVWLPEPLLNEEAWSPGPEVEAEFAQDVSVAFLLVLERLSPLERATFLLHDVFDLDFEEIGRRLERSPAACRQLATRARSHVKADYTRREVGEEERGRLFSAFREAVQNLDVEALASTLTEDAVMLSDGGGKVRALPGPLHGAAAIAKAFIGFARSPINSSAGVLPISHTWRWQSARINGLPGCLIFDGATGQMVQTITLAPALSEPGRIGALYFQRNPEKLWGILSPPVRRASL
jgi:RNA polymerase sigma-70 factor, ECF subfamily